MGRKRTAGYEAAVEEAVKTALRKLDLETKVRLLTGANFWAVHGAAVDDRLRRAGGGEGRVV